MEDRKNTNCGCLNDFTTETFNESFGSDDSQLKKCNNCPNMVYEDGIMTCKKFCNM